MYAAWIDESQSNRRTDPGTYLLAAAVLDADRVDTARETMRSLLLRGQKKLHWRDDRDRQEQIIKVVAGLEVEHVVAVRSIPDTTAHPERQRRLCLDRLLPELVALGVSHAVVESRGRKDDLRDRTALDNARRRQLLAGPLRLDHVGGPGDPLLWVPDACCGALTQDRCGESTNFAHIKTRVTLLDVVD